MLRLDEPTSTVVIAGRHFPAVGVVCPQHPDDPPDEPRSERLLGADRFLWRNGTPKDWRSESIYVPAENGVLVDVGWKHDRPGLEVGVVATQCEESLDASSNANLWLPARLMIVGKRLEQQHLQRDPALWGPWRWTEADEGWVAEFIDRLATFTVAAVEGPSVQLVRLAEAFDLAEELAASRD